MKHDPSGTEEPPQALTPRESDVLQLVADGRTNTEIAEALGIAFRTVKSYVSSACLKLRARNRAAAVAKAFLTGQIREELKAPHRPPRTAGSVWASFVVERILQRSTGAERCDFVHSVNPPSSMRAM
jgi:DNA-binding CsgD family transcriptional regulator